MTMESIKELFKIGLGPSSSHTMGPNLAAKAMLQKYGPDKFYQVTLYGSLALTGKGHLTDEAIIKVFQPERCKIIFDPSFMPFHPNAMRFEVFFKTRRIANELVYSVGGGTLVYEGKNQSPKEEIYPHENFAQIKEYIEDNGISLYEYVLQFEDDGLKEYLKKVIETMFAAVEQGLKTSGTLPGKLKLERVARSMHQHALNTRDGNDRKRLLISAYSYATTEQNASGNTIVTAPTCGASGVIPAILYYYHRNENMAVDDLVPVLCVMGIVGNVIKRNATISGADGGCQAEIGSACAMAAAGVAWILELNNSLIEYAAEMGLEHNLGLTCDPVGGYVQIPCIERNGFAALRAVDSAMYAKQLGYLRKNRVSLDAVINVMKNTGKDLNAAYKETSLGGLAKELLVDED